MNRDSLDTKFARILDRAIAAALLDQAIAMAARAGCAVTFDGQLVKRGALAVDFAENFLCIAPPPKKVARKIAPRRVPAAQKEVPRVMDAAVFELAKNEGEVKPAAVGIDDAEFSKVVGEVEAELARLEPAPVFKNHLVIKPAASFNYDLPEPHHEDKRPARRFCIVCGCVLRLGNMGETCAVHTRRTAIGAPL